MKPLQTLIGATLLAAASLASATVQYTFYANGVTENYAQQGEAIFSFSNDGSTLSITLINTLSPTAAIQSEISGLSFTFSSAPASMALVSVTPTNVIDCSNASSPCPPGAGSNPYGWGVTLGGGTGSLGAGYNGSGFSYQPYGIVNSNYLSSPGNGGLSTPSTNPLLAGPVTFTFALAGLSFAPEVGRVAFAFGDPDIQDAVAVPEPQSLALLAIGLLSAAWVARRRNSRADSRR
jgi:hypothetical protein